MALVFINRIEHSITFTPNTFRRLLPQRDSARYLRFISSSQGMAQRETAERSKEICDSEANISPISLSVWHIAVEQK